MGYRMASIQEGTAMSIEINRTAEPWVGTFGVLGRVLVSADGSFEVSACRQGDEPIEVRERVLRLAWAEPLAMVRRGGRLIAGTSLAPPLPATGGYRSGATERALLLVGSAHDVAIAVAVLILRRWRLIADRPLPVSWGSSGEESRGQSNSDDTLFALPGWAPLVVSQRRAELLGLVGEPIRTDSDALEIETERVTEPLPVGGLVQVSIRGIDEPTLDPLTGFDRMSAVSRLFLGGALAPDGPREEPAEALRTHLRLAEIPAIKLRLGETTLDGDLDALVSWWNGLEGLAS